MRHSDAYDNTTGIFTAPLDGDYEFMLHALCNNDTTIDIYMVVDGVMVRLAEIPNLGRNFELTDFAENLINFNPILQFFRFEAEVEFIKLVKILKNICQNKLPITCDLLLMVSNVKSYLWSLLSLIHLTNLSSLQNRKTQL